MLPSFDFTLDNKILVNILLFDRQYLSCQSFVQNLLDKVGLATVRITLWFVTSTVVFARSRPMFQLVANSSGPILLFFFEVLIDEIWDIFTFLCSAMWNSSSTSVLYCEYCLHDGG